VAEKGCAPLLYMTKATYRVRRLANDLEVCNACTASHTDFCFIMLIREWRDFQFTKSHAKNFKQLRFEGKRNKVRPRLRNINEDIIIITWTNTKRSNGLDK